MSETLRVAVVLHLSLAPGLTGHDADILWRECFQPLIGALHHTPAVKVGVALAGELVEELEQRHPEGLEWLRGLVERGQVELLGTALHEPVLSSVPERDAIGQIQAHATLLKKVFGTRPTGMWLPHGVWDPVVPRIAARADMAYTIVEDRLIASVCAENETISGVWRTEREGHVLAVLAADSRVRESAPDVTVRQILGHLERRAKRGHGLIAIALTANRFANRRDQSWLATLLVGLGQASPLLQTVTPSEAIAAGPFKSRVYLPSGAPREQLVPWERCLLRYEEANRLHKRMVRVSRLVDRLSAMIKDGDTGGFRPDPSQLVQANRYLYRAQAAPVYMHGPHPGIYDPRLRHLAWRDVLRAERVALDAMRVEDRFAMETTDVDCDGNDDVCLRTPGAILVIDRTHSAGVIELSIPSAARNLVDTLTRKPELYHAQITDLPEPDLDATEATEPPTKGEAADEPTLSGLGNRALETAEQRELARALATDKRPRVAFVEHLIGPDVTISDLQKGTFQSIGKGLKESPWTLVSAERHGEDAVRALLYGDGFIDDLGGERSVRIHKRYTVFREPVVDFRLEVLNRGHEALRTRLALELDLAPTANADTLKIITRDQNHAATSIGDLGDVDVFSLESPEMTVRIELKKPARLWHYPIETVHQDGPKMVLGHQGVCLVLVWPVELWGQEKLKFDVRLTVET